MDVLNPLQSRALDLRLLAERYKGRVAFSGGMDTQVVLPKGGPDGIRREVSRLVEILRSPQGGYIGGPCTTVMPETPLESIEAMCEAFAGLK